MLAKLCQTHPWETPFVLLSSSRRAEVTGRTGGVAMPRCVCWAPQIQGTWSQGWFESVTSAGPGEAGCQGRAGSVVGGEFVSVINLLFLGFAPGFRCKRGFASSPRLFCGAVPAVGARGDVSGFPHPASRCHRAGGYLRCTNTFSFCQNMQGAIWIPLSYKKRRSTVGSPVGSFSHSDAGFRGVGALFAFWDCRTLLGWDVGT